MKAMHRRRLADLEARLKPEEDPPALFIQIEDAGIPDPDAMQEHSRLGEILGVITGAGAIPSMRLSRRPGESLAALQRRAARALPHCRVFHIAYAGFECSRAQFDGATEWQSPR